jgi:hypothetical protein
MLILAGITISIAMNGGLFQQANTARENTLIERYREKIELELAEKQIEKLGQLTLAKLVEEEYRDINEDNCVEKEGYVYEILPNLQVKHVGKLDITDTYVPTIELFKIKEGENWKITANITVRNIRNGKDKMAGR